MTTLPLDFPCLQAEALRLAEEVTNSGLTQPQRWCLKDDEKLLTAAFARLLADLTRPESRDRWAWLLADRLGWKSESLTSPSFYFAPARGNNEHEDSGPAGWWLMDDDGNVEFFTADEDVAEEWGGTYTPGLPSDRAMGVEALRLILHAVFDVTP
jgi:hypothetical protein